MKIYIRANVPVKPDNRNFLSRKRGKAEDAESYAATTACHMSEHVCLLVYRRL